jgi:CRP-like cAMP-binding protein
MVEVGLLRGGGVQALVDLAADSREVSFDVGSNVFPRGVQHQELIVLVEGEVLSTRVDPALERRYGPGDVVGGVAAFGTPALAWESRATTPVRGIAVDIEAWFELMEEHFDMVRSTLSAILARRELLLDYLAEASGGIVLT